MTLRRLAFVLVVVLTVAALHAQTPPIAFEVASVRPTNNDARGLNPGQARSGGRWAALNTTLSLLLRIAYPEHRFPGLIVGGPGWISERTFDIDAKAPIPNPSPNEYALMVRQLLAERFGLKVHIAQRPVDVYTLLVARDDGRLGPRLKPAPPTCVADYESGRLQPQVVPPFVIQAKDKAPPPKPCMPVTHEGNNVRRTFGVWSFAATTSMLQLLIDRKLVDRTGLKGFYELDFEYDPRTTQTVTNADDLGVSFFTALQEQLGLKLERQRETMGVLVIDSVEMPTEN